MLHKRCPGGCPGESRASDAARLNASSVSVFSQPVGHLLDLADLSVDDLLRQGPVHVDVKYLPRMADENRRGYLFVAIDRATRWVLVRVYSAKTAANAHRF